MTPAQRRRRRLLPLLLVAAGLAAAAVVAFSGAHGRAPATTTAGAHDPRRARSPRPPRRRAAPAQMSAAASRTARVPILMYHVINKPAPGVGLPELYVRPSVFAAEMRALAGGGYHGVTLAQVWRAWREGGTLPHRPVVVSFDDGYLSHYTHARPILRSLGWPGVLNLEVGKIGASGAMSSRQIRALAAEGWEIDSHTISHPDLRTLAPAQLRHELVASRAFIRRRFGSPARFFCYPAGKYDARVEAAVKAAGYLAATTVQIGLAKPGADPYALDRVRVNGSDTAGGLVRELAALGA